MFCLGGGWKTCDPQSVSVGCSSAVKRMVAVAGKLWCATSHSIKILNTNSLLIEVREEMLIRVAINKYFQKAGKELYLFFFLLSYIST